MQSIEASESRMEAVVVQTSPLLSAQGMRGTTVRDIASKSGESTSTLVSMFGDKNGIVAACFNAAAARDIVHINEFVDEIERINLPAALAGPYLATLCEQAGGPLRDDMRILLELWLFASLDQRFTKICSAWLKARRDAFRRLAAHFVCDELAFDFLTLHVLAESSFAVSCARSSTYTVVASAGFIETFAMVTGLGPERVTQDIENIASRFYVTFDASLQHPQNQSGSDIKEKIVAASAHIIEREGFASVTNRAVAKEAGVSLASTTYHFSSIEELATAGFRRVFETANRRIASDTSGQDFADTLRQRVSERSVDSRGEYARSRGMTEISLAASREILPWTMGLEMRQQRGLITFTAASTSNSSAISRLKAASYALWSSAASITAASIPDADQIFDFDAQSELALSRLLLL